MKKTLTIFGIALSTLALPFHTACADDDKGILEEYIEKEVFEYIIKETFTDVIEQLIEEIFESPEEKAIQKIEEFCIENPNKCTQIIGTYENALDIFLEGLESKSLEQLEAIAEALEGGLGTKTTKDLEKERLDALVEAGEISSYGMAGGETKDEEDLSTKSVAELYALIDKLTAQNNILNSHDIQKQIEEIEEIIENRKEAEKAK